MASSMEHWKVTMLGDGGVGKTALAVQFTQKQFIETYDPTIEDSYRKQVFVDGKMSFLEIIDTAGQEDYSTLREQWIREGQGFILVYSVTNQNSFQNIDRFRKTMNTLHTELPVFLIIGNKADDAYRREVSAEQGLTYARRHNCEFYEASAKTGQNVEKLFGDVVRQLRANSRSAPAPLTPNSITSTNGRGSSRTSTSGFTGSGTATPLTVPSTGSVVSHNARSRGAPFSPLDGSSGSAYAAAPYLNPAPSPRPQPKSAGSGSSSPNIPSAHASGSTRARGSSNGRSGPDPSSYLPTAGSAANFPIRDPYPSARPSHMARGAASGSGGRPQVQAGNGKGPAPSAKFKPPKGKPKEKEKGGCVIA